MKFCIVANWFGGPPAHLQFWFDSLRANARADWLFVTDLDLRNYDLPPNLTVYHSSCSQLKDLFKTRLGYEVEYCKAWDFCSFKPVLGCVFAEELHGYDYWGWSDLDLIYGDLNPLFDACEKNHYDKILPKGHLSLIRNDKLLNEKIISHPLTRKILETGGLGSRACFDEFHFPNIVLPDIGANQSIGPAFANLHAAHGNFALIDTFSLCDLLGLPHNPGPNEYSSCPFVLSSGEGKLKGWFVKDGTLVSCDLVYFHFYKHTISFDAVKRFEPYLIIPNRAIPDNGMQLTPWKIRWLDRPMINWKWVKSKANLSTIYRKIQGG